MKNISSSDAFLMFRLWHDKQSPLQVQIRKSDGKGGSSPSRITETSESESAISALIVFAEQSQEWRIDFTGAKFSIGKPEDTAMFPEYAEGKWVRYLFVELPDNGTKYLFLERFVDTDDDSMR